MSSSQAGHTWDPFDSLSSDQLDQLQEFEQLLVKANRRANLVSRPSIGEIRHAHTRHSLVLSVRQFPAGSVVVDWGTGGGLPGIPLAIRFPDVQFVLLDSIGKKTDLVRAMTMKLGLNNVDVAQSRAETWDGDVDFAVSRATAPLVDLWTWTERVSGSENVASTGADWNAGLLALKGGDLSSEIANLERTDPTLQIEVTPIRDFMDGPYEDKYVVEVSRPSNPVTE